MPVLNRSGVKIAYEVSGLGPPLLLTHGFTEAMDVWDAQAADLARSFKLISWDLRGHGRSDYPGHAAFYARQFATSDMAALLDAAKIDRAVLVGRGLGAELSLEFERRFPKRVRALVLIGAALPPAADQLDQALYVARFTAQSFLGWGFSAPRNSGPPDPVLVARHRNPVGLSMTAEQTLVDPEGRLRPQLGQVAAPALILNGARFLPGAQALADALPNARVEAADDAQAQNLAIRAFLNDLAKAKRPGIAPGPTLKPNHPGEGRDPS